jgi:beta-carotene 15,15'-dioxygenase
MNKYSNIAMVASFFGLWLDSYLSDKNQILLGFFFIFTFGILHGANDLMLIKTIKSDKQVNSWQQVLLTYVVVVLFGIALFYLIPQVALLLFILVSAYHFGEQEWQQTTLPGGKWFVATFQSIYGLLILSLLFVFHQKQVQEIVLNICQLQVPNEYFNLLLVIVTGLFLSFCIIIYWRDKLQIQNILKECFYIVLYSIIFKSSSLIWGFAIYFVIWHSIPSIKDQIQFLNGSYKTSHFINY